MQLIDNFKQYYQAFDQHSIDRLDNIYAQEIVFSDPLHQLYGLDEVKAYFSAMCKGLTHCHFEFLQETVTQDNAWFKWIMHYQHPKLRKGALLKLKGASFIGYSQEKQHITAHEDFYDMGNMLYEHTPVLGSGVRWLKQQLLKAS